MPIIFSAHYESLGAINEAAKFGIAVDPNSACDVARALTQLLDDPAEAEAMSKRGRALILAEFNWQLDSRKLTRLYDELLIGRT